MVEVDAYLLENDEYYNEIDSVYYNDTKYVLLANENDSNDVCIRKVEVKGNEDYISVIDSKEFDKVCEILINKNEALF